MKIVKMVIFDAVIKETSRITLLKTGTKNRDPYKALSIYLMQRTFSGHELPPLGFEKFSSTIHNPHMILTSAKYNEKLPLHMTFKFF